MPTFRIFKALLLVSRPAKTKLHTVTGMLSERQKDSCHPLPAEKSIMDSLVLKTEVQGHVVRGPPSPGPAFLTASSFFSLRSSQVLSWGNMGGSRSYHLPALHSRDVYYCDPLNLGQWHAPTCRCSEEWMRWKPLLGMSNRAFITLIHPFQTPPLPVKMCIFPSKLGAITSSFFGDSFLTYEDTVDPSFVP